MAVRYHEWKARYQKLVKDKLPVKWAQFVQVRKDLQAHANDYSPQYSWVVAACDVGPMPAFGDGAGLLPDLVKEFGLPPEKGFLRARKKVEKAIKKYEQTVTPAPSSPQEPVAQQAPAPPAAPSEPVEPAHVYDHDTAKPMKMDEQVRWVQANMHRVDIEEPRHVPNLEVWNLYLYAARDPDGFFEKYVQKLMPTRSQLDAESNVQETRELDATLRRVQQAAAVASETLPIMIIPFRHEGDTAWSCRLVDKDTAKVLESRDGFIDEDAAVIWGCQRRDDFFEAHIMPDVESITG